MNMFPDSDCQQQQDINKKHQAMNNSCTELECRMVLFS